MSVDALMMGGAAIWFYQHGMNSYRFFALDSTGRVDRGFEQAFASDADAIRFADEIADAAVVEVLRGNDVIARVRHSNGRTTIITDG